MTCRVYLGRLPYGTRQRDVEKFFRNYGRLREINLKDGYGFVVRVSIIYTIILYHFCSRFSMYVNFLDCEPKE